MSIDYYGFHSSAPQYAGWGGGSNVFFSPIKLKVKNQLLPMHVQLGGGFHMGGAGQGELKSVVTGTGQKPMDISFDNSFMSGYALSRFATSAEGKRSTSYFELFAGVRSSSSSLMMHTEDHEDCTTNLVARSFGFSGGVGAGTLIRVLPGMNLDLGVQWQGTTAPGKFIDMKSFANTGDGISYRMKNAPAGMLLLKVGIQFQLNKNGCCGVRNCSVPAHHSKCGDEH
jgi:hypothetical protein